MIHLLRFRQQRGSSQIELALSLLIVLFLVFWIWEGIMVVYTYSTISDAAKEGVRWAIVRGSDDGTCASSDDCKAQIANKVTEYARLCFHDIDGMTVSVTYNPEPASPSTQLPDAPARVSVTVAYAYVPWIPLPWSPPTIHATAEGRLVR